MGSSIKLSIVSFLYDCPPTNLFRIVGSNLVVTDLLLTCSWKLERIDLETAYVSGAGDLSNSCAIMSQNSDRTSLVVFYRKAPKAGILTTFCGVPIRFKAVFCCFISGIHEPLNQSSVRYVCCRAEEGKLDTFAQAYLPHDCLNPLRRMATVIVIAQLPKK